MAKARRKKKPKFSGLRKYWPHLTLKECELERQKISEAQNHACGVCGKPESHFNTRLAVEHRHSDGRVRGLACYRCNHFLIGRFTLKTILPVAAFLAKGELDGELKEYFNATFEIMKKKLL